MKKLFFQLGRDLCPMIRGFPVGLRWRRAAHCAGGILITLFTFSGSEVQATTTYYSTGSTDVNTPAHWKIGREGTGTSPADFGSGDAFVIQNGHSMTTTAGWTLSGPGNEIQIESGGTLTATYIAATTTFRVDSGGTYVHNAASGSANGLASDIPGSISRDFGAGSTVEIQQWANGGTTPSPLPAAVAWGNLKINVALLGGDWQQSGGLTTVNGSLTISATGGKSLVLSGSGGLGYILTIAGDLNIAGGTLDMLNAGTGIASQINLGGNYNQTGGTFTRASTSATPTGAFLFTGGSALTTFSRSAGTFTADRMNLTVDTGKTVKLNNNLNTGTVYSRQFSVGGTLLCGTDIVLGSAQFILNAGGTLQIGDPSGISSGTTASGNIQTTSSSNPARDFGTNATYIYSGITGAQTTGNGLPQTVTNLTIDNADGIGLSRSTAVKNSLTLTSGTLDVKGNSLAADTLAGTGTINNSGVVSSLTVGGNGGSSSFSGAISGALTLTQSGAGLLTLTAVSGYTGNTTISHGKLALSGGGSINGSPTITVGSNAVFDVSGLASDYHLISGRTLKGLGTVTGPVTVDSGATLTVGGASGTPAGTLTVNSALTLAGSTTLRINKDGSPASDLVQVSGGNGNTLAYGGTLTLTTVGSAPAVGETYTLFNASGYSGAFTGLVLPGWADRTRRVSLANLTADGTISITANHAPTSAGLNLVTEKGVAVSFPLAKYADDPDGDFVRVQFTAPSHGAVSLSGGTVTYTPATDYTGSDSFTYQLTDPSGAQSAAATVAVTVNGSGGLGASILSVAYDGGTATINFAGIPGAAYDVQETTALDGTWTTVGNRITVPITGTPGVATFVRTGAPSSAYYRTVYVGGP
jgi:autotransporter-associated beta strand protein